MSLPSYADPTNVAMALVAGARQKGVKIIRQCRATNMTGDDANDEWFAKDGVEPCDHYSLCRKVAHDEVAAGFRAVRENIGIMDISAFTKVRVSGPDAEGMLDRRGRIELETTVIKLGENDYYLACATFFEQRLIDHLIAHRDGADVRVDVLSTDWSALAINTPHAREVLAACTYAEMSNASFRWLTAQEITVAGHKLWACRMSYAEELTNEVTLPEAGVMRFVKLDKDYLGKEQTVTSFEGALPWICACVRPHVNIAGTDIAVIIVDTPRKGRILREPDYDPKSLQPRGDT